MADTNITMTTAGGVRLETEGTYVDTDIVVAPDSTSQANLIPENIRSGVSILDVDGTLNPQDGLSMYTTTATLVTTGTGTIAATAINLPTGRTLQVDDLLVDTAGTVVRVTAVGTNVSYSYYASYRGPAGAAGTDGTDGTDGKDGLSMYPTTTALSSSGGSIAASNITLPEFRSIQIGDLLLGTNGVVGRVTSTGSTVRYTAFTDIHGENGEDGANGAPGANGRPALTCNGLNVDTQGEPVESGNSFTTGMATLNQTPVIGDKFTTILNTATDTYPDGKAYLCGCNVTAVNGDLGTIGATFTFSIQTVNSITGQRGPAGQGVPTGGTTGQVLKKASNTNYDTVWADASGGGGGSSGDEQIILQVNSAETPSSDSKTAIYNALYTAHQQGNSLSNIVIEVEDDFSKFNQYGRYLFSTDNGFIYYGYFYYSTWDPIVLKQMFVAASFEGSEGQANVQLIDDIAMLNSPAFEGTPTAPTPTDSSGATQIATKGYVDSKAGIQSNTASQSAFSTVSNIVTTTADSPDASSLPEGTLVIKIAS